MKARTSLRRPLASVLWPLWALRGAPRLRLCGHVVVDATDSGLAEGVAAKLVEVFSLVDDIAPLEGRRVRQHVSKVIVADVGGPMYLEAINSVLVSQRFLCTSEVSRIASVFIHEATHARLHLRGYFYTRRTQRRIEIRCLKTELAFLQKLPNSRDLCVRVEQRLQELSVGMMGPWSREEQRRRAIQRLQDGGVPMWLVKLYSAVRYWRMSR